MHSEPGGKSSKRKARAEWGNVPEEETGISFHSRTSNRQKQQPELKKRELEGHVLAERGVVTEQPAQHGQAVCLCDAGGCARRRLGYTLSPVSYPAGEHGR